MVAASASVSSIRPVEVRLPVDPGQQAAGPRPARPVDHALSVGPPESLSAGALPPPRQITRVAVVSPLLTVARVSKGVAIFGTAGGRAVIP
ncbi:MAG TPA: hypothetical protein VMW62_08245 [Chloroflexota bacterium]|nr:hypothetical protein [Chloroflexota bacterium]